MNVCAAGLAQRLTGAPGLAVEDAGAAGTAVGTELAETGLAGTELARAVLARAVLVVGETARLGDDAAGEPGAREPLAVWPAGLHAATSSARGTAAAPVISRARITGSPCWPAAA